MRDLPVLGSCMGPREPEVKRERSRRDVSIVRTLCGISGNIGGEHWQVSRVDGGGTY